MRLIVILLVSALAACASLEYDLPEFDREKAASAEADVLADVFTSAVARRARVYDLSWPVLTANAALCEETTTSLGIVVTDRKHHARLAGGLRESHLEKLGVPDDPHIYHVYANSPASSSMARGDIIRKVNGTDVAMPDEAVKLIKDSLEKEGIVRLALLRNDAPFEVSLKGVARCDLAVKISSSADINASAGSGDIVIYQGLTRVLGDNALQFVIAHEAAHLVAHHPRKYVRNLIVSGGIVAGPILYSGAWIGDAVGARLGMRSDISLRRRAMRTILPWSSEFEAEADYLGAYFHARAGGDVRAAKETFEVFGRESPTSIYARATHPLVPERLVALEGVAEEIEAKRAGNQALTPNRRD